MRKACLGLLCVFRLYTLTQWQPQRLCTQQCAPRLVGTSNHKPHYPATQTGRVNYNTASNVVVHRQRILLIPEDVHIVAVVIILLQHHPKVAVFDILNVHTNKGGGMGIRVSCSQYHSITPPTDLCCNSPGELSKQGLLLGWVVPRLG